MTDAETLDLFRAKTREWLAANFPESLIGRHNPMGMIDGPTDISLDMVEWRGKLAAKGWGTPGWPKEYGGAGLGGAEIRVLDEEMTRIGAFNPIDGLGVGMFGPTLLEFGTHKQKLAWLPPLANGSIRGCQGYSEPGAGSDLASLQSFAEDGGDHYLVNGQKTWQSGGQWADFCFGLFRTDKTHKHEGISFLVIDMKQPGVETRPIRLISGRSPFCETFFTDVKVPKANRVGEEGQGWTIGKRLLQFERAGLGGGGAQALPRPLADFASYYLATDENGRLVDDEMRLKIVRHEMEARTFFETVKRAQAESRASGGPSATSSVLKNVGARLVQQRGDLIVEIMGMRGHGWDGEGFGEDELAATRNWLWNRAATIYGGSTEIQNNIIAKRVLGMLDHQ